MVHVPVLQKEVLEYLNPKPNENFIDCTIGEGGHALSILEKIFPKGKLFGIDWSPELVKSLKLKVQNSKICKRVILFCDNFANLKEIIKRENFGPVSGILFDLGLSSWHLEKSKRGFSFLRDELLDMRYHENSKFKMQNAKLTAEKIVNDWPQTKIENILRDYGEERFAKRIAKKIVETRKIKPMIKKTFQLVELIKKAVPGWYLHQKRHFATKTFQALRIAVNQELKNLERALPQALEILKPGGRLVIISFHSLEDRIVKNLFRIGAKKNFLKILTKKPITPSQRETEINPRSRSAKLRAAIKL